MRAKQHAVWSEEFDRIGWIGKYAAPGRAVHTIDDRAGRPQIFATPEAAEAAAARALCSILNGAREPQVFVPRRRPDALAAGAERDRVFAAFK